MLTKSELRQLKQRERNEIFCGSYLRFLKCQSCRTAFQIHGQDKNQIPDFFPHWMAGDGPGLCPICEETDLKEFVTIRGRHNRELHLSS